MARIMRMPPKDELPEGPHRDFVKNYAATTGRRCTPRYAR